MNPKKKFWIAVGMYAGSAFAIVIGFSLHYWFKLTFEEKRLILDILSRHYDYFLGALIILAVVFFFAMSAFVNNHIAPVNRVAEEATIAFINPSHRIQIEGSRDLVRLAHIINDGTQRFESLRSKTEQKIEQAKFRAEEEKNMLAMFISDLPEGILICNTEGQILFYNKKVKSYLETGFSEKRADSVSGRFIGLGRSVFSVLDKELIVHALDEIGKNIKNRQSNETASFVVVGKAGRLLRVEAAPIFHAENQLNGFILVFKDITDEIESESRVDDLLQSLMISIRTAIASTRAAIEAIMDYPDMKPDQRSTFQKIIQQDSLTIGSILDGAAAHYYARIKSRWPLVQMPAENLFEALKSRLSERLGIDIHISASDQQNWVRVDSYSFLQSMLFVMHHLKAETGATHFTFKIGNDDNKFVVIDISWIGKSMKIDILRKWEEQQVKLGHSGLPLKLREVLGHHGAEIWCYSCLEDAVCQSYLRLFLPAVKIRQPEEVGAMSAIRLGSRPEFYDFDLFNQPGQTLELDEIPLADLTFTVFDTETTGLNPKGGDEIISIGAVRIVNGRLLQSEVFYQLIDPKRSVPDESVRIHGIRPEMLEGQPSIDKVLPLFHAFAEGTILVAHNAAFDMRMLQLKEDATGVRFINPVLDTLLLSAVVHPGQESHNLEALGKRLGVNIIGRHTALGDAIATGEMFLKLIPLLINSGITTLKDARLASQKTYYARLQY
jgi:DNA polymerase-3 subunit epsilon